MSNSKKQIKKVDKPAKIKRGEENLPACQLVSAELKEKLNRNGREQMRKLYNKWLLLRNQTTGMSQNAKDSKKSFYKDYNLRDNLNAKKAVNNIAKVLVQSGKYMV